MNPTKESFQRDTKDHEMTVLLDQGAHRHLLFKKPDSSCYHFHIVTYPGHLVFSGDMGSYVFSREHDMFGFFRGDEPNIHYWSEKVEAQDKSDGLKEFSFDKFKKCVREDVESFLEESEWAEESKAALVADIDEELPMLAGEGGQGCHNWACGDYSFTCEDGEFSFQDFCEHNCDEYTYRFVWCCWAIIYAIAKYRQIVAPVTSQYAPPTEQPEEEA